jgi:predicted RNA binding protein YcfA (HicA-like mRNA interferase family)
MKIPRDLSSKEFIKLLNKIDYFESRQSGSHIRLTKTANNVSHHITIPNHNPIKTGTLNSIIKDISGHLEISKDELLIKLFKK